LIRITPQKSERVSREGKPNMITWNERGAEGGGREEGKRTRVRRGGENGNERVKAYARS